MEKNSTLNNKLKSYSALAGTLVAAGAVDAQVVYTDVAPDATVAIGGTYDLDLDNNAVVDFQFGLQHGTYMYGTFAIPYDVAIIANGAGNAVDTTGSLDMATNHAVNDAINASAQFNDGEPYSLLGLNIPLLGYGAGNFLGTGDGYIGLRFVIGTNNHYGWVRINLNSTSTLLTIKDHGYDATANTQILCGALTSVNEDVTENNTVIFGSDRGIVVRILGAEAVGSVTVSDLLGKVVAKSNITGETTLLPVNGTSSVYLVTVTDNNGNSITKKIFKR